MSQELEEIDLEKIRAVCSQQSRTQWTAIATRDRLYQFMAMSDEEAQREMRESLGTFMRTEESGSTMVSSLGDGRNVPHKPRGVKR